MKQLLFAASALLVTSCSIDSKPANKSSTEVVAGSIKSIDASDTVVGSKVITNEIAGSAYRKRATGYFIITGKDTSNFMCILMESKENGKVQMDIRAHNIGGESKTYKQRMIEIKKVLPFAAKEYSFDSIRSVYLGVLTSQGDLAIEITKQYIQKFGSPSRIDDYKKLSSFLLTSKLATDLNSIFSPYNLSVSKVSIEKAFFTDKKNVYWASKIESDSTEVPDRILSCMTWVALK